MKLEVKLYEMKLDPVCDVLMTLCMHAWPRREQAAAAGIVWKMFIAGVMKNTMCFDYLVESRLFFLIIVIILVIFCLKGLVLPK